MKYIILLNQEDLSLAKEEVMVITDDTTIQFDENVALANTNTSELHKKLALSHEIWEYRGKIDLIKCSTPDQIKDALKEVHWNLPQGDSFLYRYFSKDKKHKEHNISTQFIGKGIKDILLSQNMNLSVDTKNPNILIKGICTDKYLYLGIFKKKIDKSYQERKPHLRILPKPVSLAPRIAKAMINTLGAKQNEIIIDPCCGTGGLLIEAGLLNKRTIGIDIDKEMIYITKSNLEHYKIKNYDLICQDIFSYQKHHPFLVTDLPYFKNTKGTGSIELYGKFIEKFFSLATKKICLCCKEDEEIDIIIKKIVEKHNWQIKKKFILFIHKSLNRKIYLIIKTEALKNKY